MSVSALLAEVGAEQGISASFMAYRIYLQAKLRHELGRKTELSAADLIRTAQRVYGTFLPTWQEKLIPIVVEALEKASQLAGYTVPRNILEDAASSYAAALTGRLHDTSMEAAVRGFTALSNRQVPPRQAAATVVDSWGITNRNVNSLVTMTTAKEKPNTSNVVMLQSSKKRLIKRFVDGAISDRAKLIGQQEDWNLHEQGKQISWSIGLARGELHPRTKKVWVTAHDERVCPTCGPLNGKKVRIDQQFPGGFSSPPLHVNCRCTMQLRYRFLKRIGLVKKADDNDWETQPRGSDGRFGNRTMLLVDHDEPEKAVDQKTEVEFYRLVTQLMEEQEEARKERARARARRTATKPKLKVKMNIGVRPPEPKVEVKPAIEVKTKVKPKVKAKVKIKPKIKVETKPKTATDTPQKLDRPLYGIAGPIHTDAVGFVSDIDEVKGWIKDQEDLLDSSWLDDEGKTGAYVFPGLPTQKDSRASYLIQREDLRKIIDWARRREAGKAAPDERVIVRVRNMPVAGNTMPLNETMSWVWERHHRLREHVADSKPIITAIDRVKQDDLQPYSGKEFADVNLNDYRHERWGTKEVGGRTYRVEHLRPKWTTNGE